MNIIDNFKKLDIVDSESGGYKLNEEFARNVEEFLKNQLVMAPVDIPDKPDKYEP